MDTINDYAKMSHMDAWLRHPVLGDPSFDTFERVGEAVHWSEAPYEWAVNCSVFRDHDGTWYYYAGLYPQGYIGATIPKFRIYRSTDQGAHWEDLGWGFEEGFRFDGDPVDSSICPDAVVFYDENRRKYLMTYDTGTNTPLWEPNPVPGYPGEDGAALAWADSPAGPFHRLPNRVVSRSDGGCGRYERYYASTVIPREKDYLALVLMDSGRHYAWGLAALTAPSPEGPWSRAHMVLCCDRPEYYPCPVEFYPAQVQGGTVICPATSVAMNRNYQAIFEAPLEEAHDPTAWKLTANGNCWHSRDRADEHYGIWGQTYHGFVEPGTGRYVVAFPAKDARDHGVLNLAARPWDRPHSDGFTLSAHGGPAISPLLAAYGAFTLEGTFSCKGTVDLAFGYNGTLGPNESCSDSVPSGACLSDYSAVRLQENRCAVLSVSAEGEECVLAEVALDGAPERLRMVWKENLLCAWVNGTCLCQNLAVPAAAGRRAPLALILKKFSRITCDKLEVTGEAFDYTLAYNAIDALLGAGQWMPEPGQVDPAGDLDRDVWHRIPGGYAGEGLVAAKWNVIGSRFELPLQKSPAYGTIGIWVDGIFHGSVDLQGQGETTFRTGRLKMGPHAIRVAPIHGRIAITKLLSTGKAYETSGTDQ